MAPPAWPAEGLERVTRCPACGSPDRSVLHDGLVDTLFGAPGAWRMLACSSCRSAYLDPRPAPGALPLAYARYYTHEQRDDDDLAVSPTGMKARVAQWLVRQHVAQVYAPAGDSRFLPGASLLRALHLSRAQVDATMRHLPRPWGHARLLDIGCGSGRFMAWARYAGWHCTGTEVDDHAAARARALGFEVHAASLEALVASGRRFEQVTLSHVVEHVHDPALLLRQACSLLVPGGRLWLETPNAQAFGHDLFGPAWRGLEPPRHLQLFTVAPLRRLCEASGFVEVVPAPWQPGWRVTFGASRMLASGMGRKAPRWRAWLAPWVSVRQPERSELITLIARAPGQRVG